MKLPSGAELVVTNPPFKISKVLYQAVLEEARKVDVASKSDLIGMLKGVILTGMYSSRIEAALEPCMKYATYNGLKIDADTFEKVEAREDYAIVCWEVAHANVSPFLKNLSVLCDLVLERIEKGQE